MILLESSFGDTARFGAEEMTADAYHAAPGISKSHLDNATKSSKHYWAKQIDPKRERHATAALDMGHACHYAILQPDLFTSKVAQIPNVDGRATKGKQEKAEFYADNMGKLCLPYGDYENVLGLRDAASNHQDVHGLLAYPGRAEESFFARDPETGALLKCRTDYIYDDLSYILDVKSSVDASPEAFGRDAGKYYYDVQAPWYSDIVQIVAGRAPRFAWIVFEKEPPYAMAIYYATPELVEAARRWARRTFLRILSWRERGVWTDYAAEPRALVLPGYIKRG